MKETQFSAWKERNLAKFSPGRRETLDRFLREIRIQGASRYTVANYIKAVRTLGFDGKPFEDLDEEGVMRWMEALESNGFAESTINATRAQVKHFLRWVHGCKSRQDPTPPCLRCIRKKNSRRELPKEILTRAEIHRMLAACTNQRDRALVFVLYEAGCRAAELLGLRVRDVEFDRYGAVLRVHGKTGERRIRLVESTPDLSLWISMCPDRENPDAPLWPRFAKGKGPLGESGLAHLLERIAKAARIKKHVHPHLLRHSRATHLATVLKEAQMREFFGWTKDSVMPSIYVHLSGRDVDSTLLSHYGIKQVEAEPEDGELLPRPCPRCGFLNSVGARYCQRCSSCLDVKVAQEHEEIQKLDSEISELLVKEVIHRAPDLVEAVIRERGMDKIQQLIDKLGNKSG